MARDYYCSLCMRELHLAGIKYTEKMPKRAVAEVRGISVCALHIATVERPRRGVVK